MGNDGPIGQIGYHFITGRLVARDHAHMKPPKDYSEDDVFYYDDGPLMPFAGRNVVVLASVFVLFALLWWIIPLGG
jgi:hypothetical protein